MSRLVLGVDGGSTKTHAVIVEESGRVLGHGFAGSSNIDEAGLPGTEAALTQAAAAARRAAGLGEAPFEAAFLGLASIVSDKDRAIIAEMADRLCLAQQVGIDHDIRIALAGGLSGRPGVALIAGTGSSCFGINAAGERWQAGGWGHLIADEGSSYWLGMGAIRGAMGAFDGRWSTALLEPVRAKLDIADMHDILHRVYIQGLTKAEIAAFAPLVIEAARAGDGYATELIAVGMEQLALCVTAVARRLGWAGASCELALVGGLFKAGETVISPLTAAVHARLPACRITLPELPPALGAALLALRELDVEFDGSRLAALREGAWPERF